MTFTRRITSLKDVMLFRGLTDDAIRRIGEALYQKNYPVNTMVLTEGQPGEVVYLIISGTVKIFTTHSDGTEVIVNILGAGDTLGEMSIMEDSVGRSASAVTLEDSEIMWMQREAFQRFLADYPRICKNLVLILNDRLRLTTEQIQSYAALDVNGRVARQILAFDQRYGQETEDGSTVIPIRLTQSDVSELVGASRKRVNQIMVMFKRQGLISVDDDYRITLLNKDGLKAYCR